MYHNACAELDAIVLVKRLRTRFGWLKDKFIRREDSEKLAEISADADFGAKLQTAIEGTVSDRIAELAIEEAVKAERKKLKADLRSKESRRRIVLGADVLERAFLES